MGDSLSRGYEIDDQIREDKARKRAAARKRQANGYKLEQAIADLLGQLNKQQLNRQTWKAMDHLEEIWFGREGR